MTEANRKKIKLRSILVHIALVVFDILAVNCSYICALLIRYYVAFSFNEWAVKFVGGFFRFAPYYTVCCLIVFWIFRLYNSRWKYASLSDLNRILAACLVTTVIQVLGSVIFVMRMPMTYYILGAIMQFALITVSRFSYRILLIERVHVKKIRSNTTINVMIVGVGETSRVVLKHFERDVENAAHPVCMVDFRGTDYGTMMSGIPVVYGVEKIAASIKKYHVECVILADAAMPQDVRKEIRKICEEADVEVQDFSVYFQNSRGSVSLRNILEYVKGTVTLVYNGEEKSFENGEQALMALTGKYMIKSVYAKDNSLVVELAKDILVPNDVKEEWVKTYEKETGEDISFF